LTVLVYAAIALAVAHRVGWLDRWVWFILEKEARKVCNGARVTIGSFIVDWSELLQGKITLHASNAIIHTPQRREWQWDSPLIARIGKASVECNALITVFHAVFLRREVPVEAYTILVTDVQVFVERSQSVINVYLLNPMLQLPPPPYSKNVDNDADVAIKNKVGDRVASLKPEAPTTSPPPRPDTPDYHNAYTDSGNFTPRQKASTTFFDTKIPINPSRADTVSNHDDHNQQAKVLVNEMIHAVQKLGGAASRGQLQGAIKRQGLELVGRLRGFREQENLEEGIRVMQQVGKVARESLLSAPQLILPQPDSAREMEKKIVYIRIGRIIVNDLRIFTKDSWINEASTREDLVDSASGSAIRMQSKSNSSSILSASTKDINGYGSSTNTATMDINTTHNGSWNKPIYIENMVLGSSELCPPMSMKDDHNLPVIYQSVDKIMEVIWRRVLTEIAKSNTGRLFSTAMGEVLSVMVSNPHGSISLTTTGASQTVGTAVST